MKLSNKIKIMLFGVLVILNIILRIRVPLHEIGYDSFLMHIMANSLSEFGYARWFLHPLSIFGLYPASYTSSMQFLISGISQSTGMGMEPVIFLYCLFIGLLSMFTAYLMAGEIIDNDLFKLLVAFGFSTSPAVLGYTTWTIPTRALLVVLAPLLVYLLLKCRTSVKYVPLVFLLAILLFATHHLSYYLIPAFFALFILTICFKLKNHVNIKIPEKLIPFVLVTGFITMFSIPFFSGHFIERSRYAALDINYVRYMGILSIFAIGGLTCLIFKNNKRFGEWFLLLTLIFLTIFIYQQTYMKWFIPIFVVPLAAIALINILRVSEKRKIVLPVVAIFLLLIVSFSAYYQFIHFLPEPGTSPTNERYIEESTYKTGRWMKDNINGSAVSNDEPFGNRIFATSETTRLLITSGTIDYIYGFVNVNISKFKRYPITSEDFWFSGYKGPAIGEKAWESVHRLRNSPHEFNITHLVENRKCKGNISWHHSSNPVKLLHFAYNEKDCVYDCGNINIWNLN